MYRPRNLVRCAARVLAATVLAAAGAVVTVAGPASGATFSVSNTNDAGGGSLRDAVAMAAAAAGDDEVVIPPGLGTITLASTIDYAAGSLGALTIRGNGATIVDGFGGVALSNGTAAEHVILEDLTITRAAPGGNLVRSTDAPLTVRRLTVTNGGVSIRDGALTIVDSTVSGHTSDGINSLDGPIRLERSLSTGHGDDGINTSGGTVTVVNSTIAGNDGDAVNGAGGNPGDTAIIIQSTLVDNALGGGEGHIDTENLTAFASVFGPLGDPTATACDDASPPVVTSNGYNWSFDASCGFTGPGDVQNVGDFGLGPLADNGGPTRTLLPQTGSPLIDAAPEAACDPAVTVDQRSLARPSDGNGDGVLACDVGSVEVQGALLTVRFTG